MYNGGTPIIDYIVYRKEPTRKSWVKLGAVAEESLSMSDLVLNTSYMFKIIARNKEGNSEPYISEDPIIAGRKLSKFCLYNFDKILVLIAIIIKL